MVQQPNGNALLSVSVNVTVTHARHAVWKATRLTTSFQEVQGVQMMNGICNAYAQNAILQKVVGFLVHLNHP